MDDLELTKACALAMGLDAYMHPIRGTIMRYYYMVGNVEREYNPLHDDEQAMALAHWLAERGMLTMSINQVTYQTGIVKPRHEGSVTAFTFALHNTPELRRKAIVQCVARLSEVLKERE